MLEIWKEELNLGLKKVILQFDIIILWKKKILFWGLTI